MRPDPNQYFFHSDPFVAADAIVIGADGQAEGGIHAFDRSTGRQRWKVPAGRGVFGPVAGLGRRAYAATPTDLISLDIDSGEVVWRAPVKVPGFEGPAAAMNRVFAGTPEGLLYALNAETGREEWRASLGAAVTTSVSASETAVYVGTASGTIYRVDPRTGSVLSSKKLDDTLTPRSVPVRTNGALLVLLTNQTVDYLSLVSLDAKLERIHWRQTAGKSWSTSRAFVWKKTVVLGTSSGEVTGYCVADGTKAWSHTVRGSVRSIGGSEDTLLVTTSGGSLYALKPTSACDVK